MARFEHLVAKLAQPLDDQHAHGDFVLDHQHGFAVRLGRLGQGRIDFTVGSALDIFGGSGLIYRELARGYGPNPS